MQGFTVQTVEGFDIAEDVVVIGTDAESADYDNPRGSIFGFAFAVRAVNAHGDTLMLDFKVADRGNRDEVAAEAQALADALNARLDRGLLPVAFGTWREGRAVYGSDAYIEYGQDEDLAIERMEDGADLFF